ncbi:BAG family molecular chaperone regulator 7-like [Macadamia integrifolia]|uniref:BAG family molecular chaperone regulator 7-like n=1 Tax=Macadamia integrifolia TaxID=60698 RepID=UPI001C4FDF9C|nr:BAG family molecular chaperone regulator 7-like [Macadamia integrifolia]
MSRFRRIDILEPSPSLLVRETSFFIPPTLTFPSFVDDFTLPLDLFTPNPYQLDLSPHCFLPTAPSSYEIFDSVTDLIQIEKTPFSSSCKRFQTRTGPDSYLRTLCDRVSALELGFDRFANQKTGNPPDRKYSWTAEVKGAEKDGVDRKYKWTAELKGAKKGAKIGALEKNYKWTAEFKGKGKDAPVTHSYTFKASTAPAGDFSDSDSDSEKKKKKIKIKKGSKAGSSKRVVEIEEPVDQRVIVRRQAFAKRVGANAKGKKKELSPQDAALMIQVSFRAYLIRRSKALRALRELAVAKSKLKEIRAAFNNFSYRSRIARDAEERQRFSEKIIVLLLTVDAIEGADLMVRAARRSMLDELEAMLDVVDPQAPGKLGSMKRRKFDLPDGCIQKEIAAGVAKVVQMLDEEDNDSVAPEDGL